MQGLTSRVLEGMLGCGIVYPDRELFSGPEPRLPGSRSLSSEQKIKCTEVRKMAQSCLLHSC